MLLFKFRAHHSVGYQLSCFSTLEGEKSMCSLIPVLVLPENSNVWLSFTMQGSVLLQCRN